MRVVQHMSRWAPPNTPTKAFWLNCCSPSATNRDERRCARRVHDGGLPCPKRVDDLDYTANPSLNPTVINKLGAGD
jgi:hypothetical protein